MRLHMDQPAIDFNLRVKPTKMTENGPVVDEVAQVLKEGQIVTENFSVFEAKIGESTVQSSR